MGRFLRITHPSATRQPEQALLLPFDLHVLGMPPAFNLSQDQTLQLKAMSFQEERNPLSKLLKKFRLVLTFDFAFSKRQREHPHKLSDLIVKERSPHNSVRSLAGRLVLNQEAHMRPVRVARADPQLYRRRGLN